MARRVAQSLTSAANRHTRGQRMFMRRREKSAEWTVDETNRRRPSVDRMDTADGSVRRKNYIRISADTLWWRVFHILTEQVPYTFVSVNLTEIRFFHSKLISR